MWMRPAAIGNRGRRCLVQHNIESQVYIARPIYVGGTGDVTGDGWVVGGRAVLCERGAGSRRVDSGFLGEPAFVRACGLAVRIYGPLFVARQSSSKLQVSSPPTRAPAAPQADKPNQPDKGWPSGRGADGGHGGAVQLGHSLVPSRSGIDSDPYPASKRIRTCLAAPQRGCPGGRSTSDGALGCLCGAAQASARQN